MSSDNAPDRIWANFRGENWPLVDGRWKYMAPEPVHTTDILYVRAPAIPDDLVEELKRARAEMLKEDVAGWPNTIQSVLEYLGRLT